MSTDEAYRILLAPPRTALRDPVHDYCTDECYYQCDHAAQRFCDECVNEDSAQAAAHLERPVSHADYPHEDGSLYDCAECEATCYCTDSFSCVHCAISAESSP